MAATFPVSCELFLFKVFLNRSDYSVRPLSRLLYVITGEVKRGYCVKTSKFDTLLGSGLFADLSEKWGALVFGGLDVLTA